MTDLTLGTSIRLRSGIEIPQLGLGTYQSGDAERTRLAIRTALDIGYRHIDTARLYGNECEIGEAIRDSGVPREDIFVTTKLWNTDHGFESTLEAFTASLERLDIGYVDLYLIHWPVEGLRGASWRAMEEIIDDGLVRSIGVSNYTIAHLEELMAEARVYPDVNQVEFSPFLYQEDLLEWCRERNIAIQAYSPLTKAQLLDNPVLLEVGGRYRKSPAQVLIRWNLQKGVIPLPKSSDPGRIRENADVYDFELSPEDMALLDGLRDGYRTSWDPTDVP